MHIFREIHLTDTGITQILKTIIYFLRLNYSSRKKLPINLIANFSGRKFGANGFYASPEAVDQYEETEAGILALQSKIQQGSWNLEP